MPKLNGIKAVRRANVVSLEKWEGKGKKDGLLVPADSDFFRTVDVEQACWEKSGKCWKMQPETDMQPGVTMGGSHSESRRKRFCTEIKQKDV